MEGQKSLAARTRGQRAGQYSRDVRPVSYATGAQRGRSAGQQAVARRRKQFEMWGASPQPLGLASSTCSHCLQIALHSRRDSW